MSITLNANAINQLVIGGVTVETDLAAACVSAVIDYVSNTASYIIVTGNVVNGVFVPGSIGGGNRVTVSLNTITGAWLVLETGLKGTLAPQGLATMQANIKADRNGSESFANTIGAQPGTVVPW